MAQKGSGAIGIFLLKLLGMYILWFVLHDQFLVPKTTVVYNFICFQAKVSAIILNHLPLPDVYEANQNFIIRDGHRILSIGSECSGMILFAVFAGFIIAFPGNVNSKIWFIPLGILVILIFNILRIMLLALNRLYFNSIFSFNHHVTFTYGFYAIIFGLWMIWMKYFRKVNETEN